MVFKRCSMCIVFLVSIHCATRKSFKSAIESVQNSDSTCIEFNTELPLDGADKAKDPLLETMLKNVSANGERNILGVNDSKQTFGLEMELSIEANPRLLCDYLPASMKAADWDKLTWEQKISQGTTYNKKTQSLYREGTFVRHPNAPSSLPLELHAETTGMLEFSGFIFQDVLSLGKYLRGLERSYGAGQIQAHVVFPKTTLTGLAGYTVFESDRGLVTTLNDEWVAFEKEGRIPGGNFVSTWLAPMNDDVRKKFVAYEPKITASNPYQFLIKFIIAPVLRGDDTYGKDNTKLIGFEMRQWDFPSVGVPPLPKRSGRLIESVNNLSKALHEKGNLKGFNDFSKVEMSNENTIKPNDVGLTVAELEAFQKKISTAMLALPWARKDVMNSVNPATRFSYPARPWTSYPLISALSAEKAEDLKSKIGKATSEYLQTYGSLAKASKSDSDLLLELRKSVAKWGFESGLVGMYTDESVQTLFK